VLIATVRDGLRSVWLSVAATLRQVSRRRIVVTLIVIGSLVVAAMLLPTPNAVQVRDWATSVGPWFPLAFLAAHVIVTVFPFPRTAFTLAAGLLFGPALGSVIAVAASTFSALLALWLMRAVGWQLDRLVSHPTIDAVDARLRLRGWPVVLSLRLIPAVPFSVINYAAGASSVRVLPYTVATFVGLTPGTVAFVILGDAFTGHINPLLVIVSVAIGGLGIAGLVYEIRAHHRQHTDIDDPETAVPV
jgi:uncharacterized membrane protein YdjX (TVP38/TMEM64 family)